MGDSKRKAMWLKRGLGLVLVATVGVLLVLAWIPKPVLVDMAPVSRGAVVVAVNEDGRSRVQNRYIISSPVAAKLMRIELEPGDEVKAGDVVAELVPNEAPLLDPRAQAAARARVAAAKAARLQSRAAIRRAQAAESFARQEWERYDGLKRSGAVAEEAFEQAQLELRRTEQESASARFGARVADAELDLAKAAVEQIGKGQSGETRIEVRSPVDAQVLQVFQESAGAVPAGARLLELGDPSAMELVIDVLTQDAVRIQPGSEVKITRWGEDRPLRGHVRRVDPSAFTRVSSLGVEEQRVNVVVDLDAPRSEWSSLGDGYRVEAEIMVSRSEDVLRVPSSAVFRQGDQWAVFAVRGKRAETAVVSIGKRSPGWVEIVDGLSEGDRVILHPTDRVQAGARVAPRQ